MLVEFWDFCRVNSLRTLPYLQAWHERYAEAGLRVIGVHTGGFAPARDPGERARARSSASRSPTRSRSTSELEIWDLYGNEGWPARYLWDAGLALYSLHYGEGAYDETEREIQELLGVEREPLAPLRPEDAPGALIAAQTADQPGAYSGPYEAGGVWAVVDGAGELRVNGARVAVDRAGLRRARRAPAPHRRRARARRRRRASTSSPPASPRGWRLSSAWPRSPSRRMSRGGPASSTSTAVPGQ